MFESIEVNFVCPHCGRPSGSFDGRTRTVRCACGQTLTVESAAPGRSSPARARPPPLPPRTTPHPAPVYDPVAARHGLLLDERQARALAAPEPFLVPEIDEADLEPVDVPSPSTRPPAAAARGEPLPQEPLRQPRAHRSRWPRRVVAVLALLVAAGAAAWFLVPREWVRLPPAVADLLDRARGGGPGRGEAEVAAALEASARSFRACAQAAERGPRRFRLAGRRVTLFVTVTSSGRVTAPRLDQVDLDRSPPGTCLKSAALRMVFPPRAGDPVEVRIPLDLGGG